MGVSGRRSSTAWAAMGKDLLANEPVFAATVAAIQQLIAANWASGNSKHMHLAGRP